MLKNIVLNSLLFGLILIFMSGCGGCSSKRVHEGDFFSVKLPYGWSQADKSEKIQTPFYPVSEEPILLATYVSPERDEKRDQPLATMSIYTQKFHRPLWAEDMGYELERWLRSQDYLILGQGKIVHKDTVGYSINYQDRVTDKVYLDFYFTTDHMMYMVMSGVTDAKLFHEYVFDFEAFRKNIEFSLLTFYL